MENADAEEEGGGRGVKEVEEAREAEEAEEKEEVASPDEAGGSHRVELR